MPTLILVAALCIALLIITWRWEVEKEARETAEEDVARWRRASKEDGQELFRLRAVEEAAYAMYGVLCLHGTLSDDDPTVAQYKRAVEALWQTEIENVRR